MHQLTRRVPYVIAQQGSGPRTWHIPGDKPLCGAVIEGRPERRYLPSQVPAQDETCEPCLQVYRARTVAPG